MNSKTYINSSQKIEIDFWGRLWGPFFRLSVYGKFVVVLASFLGGYLVIGLYNYYFITLLKQQLDQLDGGHSREAVNTIIAAANRYTWGGGILVAVLMLFVSITSFLCIRLLVNLLRDMKTRLDRIRLCNAETSNCLSVDQIPVVSRDEIGDVAHSLNDLVHYVQNLSLFRRTLEADETPEEVYHRLHYVFSEVLHLDSFAMWEISDNEESIRTIMAYPVDLEAETCLLNSSATCRAYRTGEIVNSAHCTGICPVFPLADVMTHCCMPMRVGGRILGVVQFLFLYVDSMERTQRFMVSLNLAQQYLREALPLLHTKRLTKNLHDMATRDTLTGLFNRRFLEGSVNTILAGIQRRSSVLGILMCDMDYFKQVNDEHGHEAGDKILVSLANILLNSVRASDMVIRYGGEEFLVLLVDCDHDMASTVAEKIRQAVESQQFRYNNMMLRKTISIGISEFPLDSGQFWEAIKFADVALYQAKERGRNQVMRFSQDMWNKASY